MKNISVIGILLYIMVHSVNTQADTLASLYFNLPLGDTDNYTYGFKANLANDKGEVIPHSELVNYSFDSSGYQNISLRYVPLYSSDPALASHAAETTLGDIGMGVLTVAVGVGAVAYYVENPDELFGDDDDENKSTEEQNQQVADTVDIEDEEDVLAFF